MDENGGITVICDVDCGNAPKKEQIKQLNIAFAKADIETILNLVTDDIVWNIVGDRTIRGKELFSEALHQMKEYRATVLEITNIITHGTRGAANGILSFGDKKVAICDIYIFHSHKDAKFKSITSYAIDI